MTLMIALAAPLTALEYCRYRLPFRAYGGVRVLGIHSRDHLGAIETDTTRNAFMIGAHGGGEYRHAWRPYGQLEGWFGRSDKKTEGENKWRFEQYEGVGRLGVTGAWGCYRTFLTIPYFGYGYRQFVDNQIVRRFVYSTYYVPVGIKATFLIGDYCELTVNSEWSKDIRCLLEYTTSVNGAPFGKGIRFLVKRRDAWLIEIPLTLKTQRLGCWKLEASLVPFYQKVWYGLVPDAQTTVECNPQNFGLPRRETQFYGARFTLGARF